MPELEGMLIPPPGLGSGKFVTPWLRMHSENARNDPPRDEAFGLCPDEPHAPIATAHTAAASEGSSRCQRRGGGVGAVADMIGSARRAGYSARRLTRA